MLVPQGKGISSIGFSTQLREYFSRHKRRHKDPVSNEQLEFQSSPNLVSVGASYFREYSKLKYAKSIWRNDSGSSVHQHSGAEILSALICILNITSWYYSGSKLSKSIVP